MSMNRLLTCMGRRNPVGILFPLRRCGGPFRRGEPAGDVGVRGRRVVSTTFPLRRDKPVGGGLYSPSLPCRLARQEGEGRDRRRGSPPNPCPPARLAGRRRRSRGAGAPPPPRTFRSSGARPMGLCRCRWGALSPGDGKQKKAYEFPLRKTLTSTMWTPRLRL
jgi:hypothetical protein